MKQAIEDVQFKFMRENADVSEVVDQVKQQGYVTKNEYRLITGACSMGCDQFIKENGLKDKVPLDKAVEIVRGAYGGERFAELISAS
jgi:hypothetical protein